MILKNVPSVSENRTSRTSTPPDGRTCPRRETVLCLTGLIQALVLKLWRLRRANLGFRRYPTTLVDEHKWRALRHGLDGQLVDFGRQEKLPARELVRELIEEFLADPIKELGVGPEVEYAYDILEAGTSADRTSPPIELTSAATWRP